MGLVRCLLESSGACTQFSNGGFLGSSIHRISDLPAFWTPDGLIGSIDFMRTLHFTHIGLVFLEPDLLSSVFQGVLIRLGYVIH